MKFFKFTAVLLALIMSLSVLVFAASETTTQVDNQQVMQQELAEFLKKNGIDKKNISFGYYDFGRDFRYTYHGDSLYHANEVIKLPLAYLYYKDLTAGKRHLNEDVGDENLREVFMRSLKQNFGNDSNSTSQLIDLYGGLETVKRAMHEITYTKVGKDFYTTDKVSTEYMLDFMEKYYNEAMYGSADYSQMLVKPLKSLSPGRFSETNIYDVKVTHRYGFSKMGDMGCDVGIINSSYPFAFVIAVKGEDYEEQIADLAEFAYDFNFTYGNLLLSQMTTLPDIPDDNKKGYDSVMVKNPTMMIVIIASTVIIAATITTVFLIQEKKKKERDRMD